MLIFSLLPIFAFAADEPDFCTTKLLEWFECDVDNINKACTGRYIPREFGDIFEKNLELDKIEKLRVGSGMRLNLFI
jgi:hypothetical protein